MRTPKHCSPSSSGLVMKRPPILYRFASAYAHVLGLLRLLVSCSVYTRMTGTTGQLNIGRIKSSSKNKLTHTHSLLTLWTSETLRFPDLLFVFSESLCHSLYIQCCEICTYSSEGGVGGAVPWVSVSAGVSLYVFTLRLTESAGSRYLTSPKSNAMGAINFP